jgi:diguanylate cyclase (GGDEF)-like protein/PAS domain S-box-containing protein
MGCKGAHGHWTDQRLATGMYLGSTVQAQLDDVIREVASGLSSVVGEEFFYSLVLLLGDAMGVDHVFVAELDYVDHDRANLVALSGRDRLSGSPSLKLGASASQLVLDQGSLSIVTRVREEFPDDEMLSMLGAESFVGRRLPDVGGISMGLLGVVHSAPLPDPSFIESLMATFTGRIAAELERRRAENVLRSNELRWRSIVDSAPVCIHEIDRSGHFIGMNAEAARQAGTMYAEEIIGRAYLDYVAPWDQKRVADMLAQARAGRICQFEYTSVGDGGTRVFSASLVPLDDEDGQVTKLLGYSQDITAQKTSEQQLVHRAEHDSLTDLPNRGLFIDRLRSGIARAKRNNQPLALLFVDLNDFKPVNDEYGHQTGDRLLRVVAQRLMAAVREVDTVARVGGDEFAVILEAITDADDAAIVAVKIAECIGEPFSIGSHTLRIGASTGIAIFPGDGDEVSTLLQHADAQMYRAKRAGGHFPA